MGGGTGGGSNGTTTVSAPLTADQRQALYTAGYNSLYGTLPANWSYQAPDYVESQVYDPGAAERMSGGDYNALEQSILRSRTAPLTEAYGLAVQQNDADMAKRGIWSSGAATKGLIDTQAKFGTLLNQAAGEAATQRYGMQQQDINNANQYNLARAGQLTSGTNASAGMANQFNLNTATARQNAAWQPANYFKDIWNNSGGTFSNSTGGGSDGGWNFMI